MNLHKTYTKQGEINGKSVQFKITEEWSYDRYLDGDFDFGNEEENQEYLDKFKSGELVNLVLGVRAEALNCVGEDSLGGCHVAADNADLDIDEIIEAHNMANVAIEDCKRAIKEHIEILTPFFVNLPK